MWEHTGWRGGMVALLLVGCSGDFGDVPIERLGSTSAALVFTIAADAAADHADDDTPGSIAWYFRKYGSNHTYVLGPGVFGISAGIRVPSYATLRGASEADTRILPLATASNESKWNMIHMSDYSTLSALQADGNAKPSSIVYADKTTGVTISDCVLRESRGSVISADQSSELSVRSSTISFAGILSDKSLPTSGGTCHGITCQHCFDFEVKDSHVNYTCAAGVYMAGTLGAVIARNHIFNTSWNMRVVEWNGAPDEEGHWSGGDGITAYHNNSNPFSVNYHIYDNHIWLFYNHGIHVSGDGINIHDNHIDGRADHGVVESTPEAERFGHSAIWVGDHRPFPGGDCSKNVTIANNEVYKGWSTKGPNFTRDIGIENYESTTSHVRDGNWGGTLPAGGVDYGTAGSSSCVGNVARQDPEDHLDEIQSDDEASPYLSPDFYYEFRHGVLQDTMLNREAAAQGTVSTVMDETLGRVLKLDGNGAVRIPHSATFNANQFTVFALVKPNLGQGAQIFSKDCSSCNQRSWQFRITNNRHLELVVFSSPTNFATLSSASAGVQIPLGEWSYVAGTYDGSHLRLYHATLLRHDQDGLTSAGEMAFSGTVADSTDDAYIGRARTTNAGYFSGRIDDVAFFKRRLWKRDLEKVIQWGHMIVPDNELLHPSVW